jgi:Mg2+/Co2+ transporter CorB
LDASPLEWPASWPVAPTLAVLSLVVLSALICATESALRNINRYRLRNLARLGNRSARRTESLLAQSDRLAATILLCRILVNVAAVVLAGQLVMELGGGAWLAGACIAVLTLLLLIIGELAPRTLGALYPEPLALPASWVYSALIHGLHPLVWLMTTTSNLLLRVFGVTASASPPLALTANEPMPGLRGPRTHQRMLASILELQSITVEDIMIPRNEISSVDISDDWDSILDTLRTTPHTRLPLCEGNLDNVIGMLHMKKVAHALAHGELAREALLRLAREREAYFVPGGITLDVQLQNFQRDRRRIALVVDEYGDIRGLVTLEDILEEIVGEFTSDPGTLHKDIHREADGSYVINGAINVRVLNRTLGWNLPTNGPRTLNGLILEYLENIPEPGTTLKLRDLSIEVLQAVDNAVKTARIRPLPPEGQGTTADAGRAPNAVG